MCRGQRICSPVQPRHFREAGATCQERRGARLQSQSWLTDHLRAHILLYALKVACHHAFALRDKNLPFQVVKLEGETRGGLAERFKAAVLKTAVAILPGVRIPHPPPFTTVRLLQLQNRLERWVSGLNHSPAKTAYASTESSNLSLSAKHCPVSLCTCSSAG